MRHKVITKDAMVEMARKLIQEEGLKKCSMRRISKELGIAEGTVYNYYDTKTDLLKDVYKVSWCETLNQLEGIGAGNHESIEGLKLIHETVCADVKKRNGLGRTLFMAKEIVGPKDNIHIRGSLQKAIQEVIAHDIIDQERRDIFSRWFFLLMMDNAVNDLVMNATEWSMVDKLLG